MKASGKHGATAGGYVGAGEAFLRCALPRLVCVVMECSSRARKDGFTGEKGDNDRCKVLGLAGGDTEGSVGEAGGRWGRGLSAFLWGAGWGMWVEMQVRKREVETFYF